MDKSNHGSLIIEYSEKFDDDLVFEEVSALCDKLVDKDGLHIIVNNLNENGVTAADKITNNDESWELFSKLEADDEN